MEQQPNAVPHYYALDELEDAAKSFEVLAEILPVYRARLETFLQSDKVQAKDIYDLITKERTRLVSLMGEARLALLEIGEEKLEA